MAKSRCRVLQCVISGLKFVATAEAELVSLGGTGTDTGCAGCRWVGISV